MKKILLLAAFVLPFLVSCDDSPSANPTAVDYSGTYRGEIKVHTNGVLSSTIADHSIQIVQAGTLATINNNVIDVSAGKITGTTLTLNKKVIPSSPTYNTELTGTGSFGGTTLVISFKEEEVDLSSGAVLNSKTWTGTLTKQ